MAIKEKIIAPGQGQVLNVLGDNQRVKLSGEDTNGTFTLVEQINPAGIGVPVHIHSREDEVFTVIEGQVEFTLADRTFIANQGTTVYLPKGVAHGFKTVGEKNRVMITVIPAGIEKMFEDLSRFPTASPDMEKILKICAKYGVTFV